MIVEISHLCNFMKFYNYHLCLACMADSCYAASFTKGEPKMPVKQDGCGTYQAAIKTAAEKVFENDTVKIYNDTAATSPDATIAALVRFNSMNARENLILISGGTDRDLNFKEWAQAIKKYMKPENLILLAGTATEKMKKELSEINFGVINEKETLEECLRDALSRALIAGSVILFSPSAKSFGKFKNEFDRGEQFEACVQRLTI